MHRALIFMKHPDARLPLAGTMLLGVVVGFVVGVFAVRNPRHGYLIEQIAESVNEHSCSGWAADSEREQQRDDIYSAVAQALIDWEASGSRKPGT